MLFIQAFGQKNYETLDARRESLDSRQQLSMTTIKTHRNYSTANEKIQSKKTRLPSFVAFKKNLQTILPQRNVFTSKGIMENASLQPLNKKTPQNHLTRYRKRDKNVSLYRNEPSKNVSLPRAKTPKIHIKSIFSFRSSEKRQAKQLLPGKCQNNLQRPFKKAINISYQSKRIHTQIPIYKNQFIGWETQSNNKYQSNL